MDVFDAIRRRRSIRKYKKYSVEQWKLVKILEAARLAPSAGNKQPWRFVVITDLKVKEKLGDWFAQVPVIIVACAVPKEAWHSKDWEEYWKMDVVIAMQNLVLAATELGLGTCWMVGFDKKKLKKALGIPKDVKVIAMTPVGYPDEEKTPVRQRKHINEIVKFNYW